MIAMTLGAFAGSLLPGWWHRAILGNRTLSSHGDGIMADRRDPQTNPITLGNLQHRTML